ACRVSGQPGASPAGSPPPPVGSNNGVTSLPARDIARRAGQAIRDVPVRVHGTISDGATQVTTLDVLVGGPDEARCTVTEAGQTVDAIRTGGHDYVRASTSLWTALGLPAVDNAAAA